MAEPKHTRRAVMHAFTMLPVWWLGGTFWGRHGQSMTATPQPAFEAIQGPAPEITPNHQFYTVSKNVFDPIISSHTWRLKLHGLVEHPLTLSLEQLHAMPVHQEVVTLMCIGNDIGGNLISTATWKGIRLRDLLEPAGVQPEGRKVVFRADDGYSTAVPVERCLRPQTLLVYGMNGEALPRSHGFPLRAIIPGYYGMKQAKWLTEIEVVAGDYQGYWEQRGWADEAIVKTTSRFDVPTHREQLTSSSALLAGIAFAGDRGIKRVEVSLDGSKTWQEMPRKSPLSPYSWTLWGGNVTFPGEGNLLLTVRATDGQERLQDARVMEPLPDGASGYHKIRVRVRRT